MSAPAATPRPVERLTNLMPRGRNVLLNVTEDEALARLATGDAAAVAGIDGQFALLHRDGNTVRMARSLGRPMRFFLAKHRDGPWLVVAERMDAIRDFLTSEGLGGQFHPSYTRMVPAHHVTTLRLLGCPDPNPTLDRFFAPERNRLPADPDAIGERYVTALAAALDGWLDAIPADAPVGVLFSGGVDSGAVLLVTRHLLLQRGEAPRRLKAFCLNVDGDGADFAQAARFLDALDLGHLLESFDVPADALDWRAAVRVCEDYKPLDIEAATMGLALCEAIRGRYPDWTYLLDGDGGDENLKDYPIEENPELTVRSVLNNSMLYQEGWGVDAVKHSRTYSGGQSRGHVRTAAPAAACGFAGFSPFATPGVIDVAEGIPFVDLTDWDHARLYALKGDVVRRGVEAVTGLRMPVFEKRRFQRGAVSAEKFAAVFPASEAEYRTAFAGVWA